MITVLDIVKQYLIANGYDGLYYHNCGCTIEDLIPCGACFDDCIPGYKWDHCGCGCGCKQHIGPKEEE